MNEEVLNAGACTARCKVSTNSCMCRMHVWTLKASPWMDQMHGMIECMNGLSAFMVAVS